MRFSKTLPFHLFLLVAVSGLIFFFQLGDAPLWDRDEPRNAGCAAEMMAAGDWVVPIFNAELRTHKPVLLYWLMMLSYSVFGVNEFGARFCSAVLGIGTVLLTYGVGRRLFDATVGLWSGLILASTIMFAVASRAATPDSLLIFCSTLALALFVYFAFEPNRSDRFGQFPDSRWAAVAIYAAMGLGVLAKGPVGLVVPTAVIGMYLLIARRRLDAAVVKPGTSWLGRAADACKTFEPLHFLRTCWAMRPSTAILMAGLVAAPWYIWVSIRTDGVWTQEFFWTHNVSRATHTMEGHSGPPILFYLGAILVGFFPWSILTIPTGLHLYQRTKQAEGGEATNEANNKASASKEERATLRLSLTFLLCWVGVYVGIFSLAQTKLPSYVTPCYPALAIMAGAFVCEWRTAFSFQKTWLKVGLGNLIAVGAILLVALPIAASRFLAGSEWVGVLGLIPILGGSLVWWFYGKDQNQHATSILAATSVAFLLFLMGVLPSEIGRHRRYDELFQLTSSHEGPIATFGHLEPSWIFYGGKPLKDFEVSEQAAMSNFLLENPNTLVITTHKRLETESGSVTDKSVAPFADFQVVHETEYFLRDRPLLLIRPQLTNDPKTRLAEYPEDRSRN